jgi:hypothetical protein
MVEMFNTGDLPEGMSDYERAAWRHLEQHWQKKAQSARG